jgi:hypothetical protein
MRRTLSRTLYGNSYLQDRPRRKPSAVLHAWKRNFLRESRATDGSRLHVFSDNPVIAFALQFSLPSP